MAPTSAPSRSGKHQRRHQLSSKQTEITHSRKLGRHVLRSLLPQRYMSGQRGEPSAQARRGRGTQTKKKATVPNKVARSTGNKRRESNNGARQTRPRGRASDKGRDWRLPGGRGTGKKRAPVRKGGAPGCKEGGGTRRAEKGRPPSTFGEDLEARRKAGGA